MIATLLAALLCASPAKGDKAGGPRPVIKNVEGDGDAVVTHSKEGRPLVVKREKPLREKIEDGLREAGRHVRDEAARAGDAIAKLVHRLR